MLNPIPASQHMPSFVDVDSALNDAWRSYTSPIEPVFHESVGARLRRWVLGSAYAMRPVRLGDLPRLSLMTAAYLLRSDRSRDQLPACPAYHGSRGLVGVSDDLGVGTIIERYRRGLYPVCHLGPMKWWSPPERAVIAPHALRIDRKTRRLLRQKRFFVTFDEEFAGVMEACAESRPGKTPLTWITPKMMHAHWALHEAGYAHSVEVWDENCHLVGGLFGLAIGGVFFAESRFAREDCASKVGVAMLHQHLCEWGFGVRDAKWISPHLASLGFRLVDRATFQDMLREHAWRPSRLGRWEVDETLPPLWERRPGQEALGLAHAA